jgi:predicted metal-dependent phosphoesterase TrpH
MRNADLHLHTLFSDGTLTPVELVKRASVLGVGCISVVDHDSVEGVAPAIEAGREAEVEVIPGIELTAEYEGAEIHILGYFIDHADKGLKQKLEGLRESRKERIFKITAKLNRMGLPLKAESVLKLTNGGSVGRLHVARALVKEGLVGNIYEAFNKFIGDKCEGYVGGFRYTPLEAIKVIKSYGGIAVMAHPYTVRNDALILECVKHGLKGLEVYYPEHSQGMINFYLKMAKDFNLLVTGGSDYHGEAKPEIEIGCVKVPYEAVQNLKEAKRDLR